MSFDWKLFITGFGGFAVGVLLFRFFFTNPFEDGVEFFLLFGAWLLYLILSLVMKGRLL